MYTLLIKVPSGVLTSPLGDQCRTTGMHINEFGGVVHALVDNEPTVVIPRMLAHIGPSNFLHL
jgi:hypothetical protein